MAQVTKKQLQKMVENINDMLDRPKAAYTRGEDSRLYPNGGHFMLDKDAGGYALEEMLSQGGVTQPIGRCSAREMWYGLRGFIEGLRAAGKV